MSEAHHPSLLEPALFTSVIQSHSAPLQHVPILKKRWRGAQEALGLKLTWEWHVFS